MNCDLLGVVVLHLLFRLYLTSRRLQGDQADGAGLEFKTLATDEQDLATDEHG